MKTSEQIIEYCQYQLTILNVQNRFNELDEEQEKNFRMQYEIYQNVINFAEDKNENE